MLRVAINAAMVKIINGSLVQDCWLRFLKNKKGKKEITRGEMPRILKVISKGKVRYIL